MFLIRQKLDLVSKEHYIQAREKILYHMIWNILPIVAMLLLLGWASLLAGKMIDESRLATESSVSMRE